VPENYQTVSLSEILGSWALRADLATNRATIEEFSSAEFCS
jgi:hypothetical protein